MTAFVVGPSQYHCPTAAFIQRPGMMASSHIGGVKMEKVEGAAAFFWPPWAGWELQAPVYTLAPKSQGAFCHSAWVNRATKVLANSGKEQ